MFIYIQKTCIETFLLTLHSRQYTANVYCDITKHRKNDVCRGYVVKLIKCKITIKQDKIRIIKDEIFRILIIYMYIAHSKLN